MVLIKSETDIDTFKDRLDSYKTSIIIKVHPFISGLASLKDCYFPENSVANLEMNELIDRLDDRFAHFPIDYDKSLDLVEILLSKIIHSRINVIKNYMKELNKNNQWLYIYPSGEWYPRPENSKPPI